MGSKNKKIFFYDDKKKNKENLEYCNNSLKSYSEGIKTEQWEISENDNSKIYHDVPMKKLLILLKIFK